MVVCPACKGRKEFRTPVGCTRDEISPCRICNAIGKIDPDLFIKCSNCVDGTVSVACVACSDTVRFLDLVNGDGNCPACGNTRKSRVRCSSCLGGQLIPSCETGHEPCRECGGKGSVALDRPGLWGAYIPVRCRRCGGSGVETLNEDP